MSAKYDLAYRRSLADPEGFWAEAAEALVWSRRWETVLDSSRPPFYRWFAGGELNACYNALDRHVENGRADQTALIHDSPVTGTTKSYSYRQLTDLVARFAGVLASLGVGKGDRVILYMPMVPEAAIAMLACARLGAVHSVVFGGFASPELASRIDDARPVCIVSASCGIEGGKVLAYKPLLDKALDLAKHRPAHCVILARPECAAELAPGRDVDWAGAMEKAEPHPCVSVAATDPLYILYTSGTTGQPKGIVRDTGGYLVALAWSMGHVFDVHAGEVFWSASDVGWVVGHSYIVYGPLVAGCTTVLYEGKPVGTPDAAAFWRVIARHKVKTLFTAPTAFRAIKREDPDAKLLVQHDISSLRSLFLAGERLDPDTLCWAETHLKVPVVDNWWQTETGWPIAANCLGLGRFPVKPGSPTKPVPGWKLEVLDEAHKPCAPGQGGDLMIKLPLPPGSLVTLWQADQRLIDTYLSEAPGYYKTADAGFIDADGYVYVMSRTDDVINVAGHRLSTGALEQVLSAHPAVAECAVIGIDDSLKGQVPLGLLVLKAGVSVAPDQVAREVVARVREEIGPIACFKLAAVVERLPKTRSGKILRGTMQKIANGQPYKIPPTIDDPLILTEIAQALAGIGFPAVEAAAIPVSGC
ncbi:MAG TPA: propionyl-CoA synthetase, partial [Magnetospirillaceae bacterium]|nr:propionyl-CoA synthetase [Magnetospirillaceae bacterium]